MAPAELDALRKGIADRIKEVRDECEMSQDDFAHAIGITRGHLSDIETYRVEPSLPAIIGVIGLHHAAIPMKGVLPDDPVDARWLLVGPVPMKRKYRPARRTRSKAE